MVLTTAPRRIGATFSRIALHSGHPVIALDFAVRLGKREFFDR